MATDGGKRTARAPRRRRSAVKPAAAALGVDLASLDWQRSGTDDGALEVAFVPASRSARGTTARKSAARPSGKHRDQPVQWVLLRVAGDPAGRVLVYDRTEWESFLDGAGKGEFDWAAELPLPAPLVAAGAADRRQGSAACADHRCHAGTGRVVASLRQRCSSGPELINLAVTLVLCGPPRCDVGVAGPAAGAASM